MLTKMPIPPKPVHILLLILLVLVTPACSAARSIAPQAMPESSAGGAEAPVADRGFESGNTSYEGQVPEVKRLVITNASISLAVKEPAQSMERIASMAEEMGGFVVTSQLSQVPLESGLDVPHVLMTIRVPAERLDEALERIRQESQREPLRQNTDSQDVTKDYTDLESRLRNLEAAETQLQTIMEAATKTEEVLQVYNELKSVREQIEIIKGQMQFYEQSAALSAITIDLTAEEAILPLTIGRWQPVGVARDALQALINALKILANIAIWTVILILPLLFLIALPFYVLIRLLRRRGRARPQPPVQAPTVK